MSLLFDQNLSDRLPRALAELYPASKHIKDFRFENRTDEEVWDLARAEGLAIVTKDADFVFLSLTRGHPPKLIYLSLGNCRTAEIRDLLVREDMVIRRFLAATDEALIVF